MFAVNWNDSELLVFQIPSPCTLFILPYLLSANTANTAWVLNSPDHLILSGSGVLCLGFYFDFLCNQICLDLLTSSLLLRLNTGCVCVCALLSWMCDCSGWCKSAAAVLFICVLCCLPCADGTPGWICGMAPAFILDRAGVARKHGLKKKKKRKRRKRTKVPVSSWQFLTVWASPAIIEPPHPFSLLFHSLFFSKLLCLLLLKTHLLPAWL